MIKVDESRNSLITEFGKEVLRDRYLLPDESEQEMFVRVASAYGNDKEHKQRLYDYMSKLWFMPASPILANAGSKRGLPISCFLQNVQDNMPDIANNWLETIWYSFKGGGIGVYYGNVRGVGERVGVVGKTSGVIPFLKVNESLAGAISQGSLRRGSSAVYLPISHPDIEEFIDIRRSTGGDPNRKVNPLNLNHAVVIDDKFMECIKSEEPYDLVSPHTGAILRKVSARELWIKILQARLETGEPYILFIDRVKEATPEHHKKAGLFPVQSNLCSEITLPTDEQRTAVCCLSSVNCEYYDSWKEEPRFIEDIMYFLDNVLEDFIENAPKEMNKAIFSALNERSVGLGAMGFHSYLQSKKIPLDNVMSLVYNKQIFEHIKKGSDEASIKIAQERGACPDAEKYGVMERFSYKRAVAPNATISILCGTTSAGIEPFPANMYTHKTLSGTFIVKNKWLDKLIKECYNDKYQEIWEAISGAGGSIQNLEYFDKETKEIFKTAFEIDQRYILKLAEDRTPLIDQAQSLNIFLPKDIDKASLHNIHYQAWKKGIKTLYYCRSSNEVSAGQSLLTGNLDECIGCN